MRAYFSQISSVNTNWKAAGTAAGAISNKHNKVLYAVPYQHFTNAIENFFSVFKSRLQKKVGISYSELKENIKETLKVIPSEIFKRIFQGSYERDEKYKRKSRKRSRRKSKQYKE